MHMPRKVGIFSGTFDPVHAGHISFALKAADRAGLEKVIFIPEPVPRRKAGVTHVAHRLAMLKLALKPHPKLEVLELPDKQFSVAKTLPRLHKSYPGAELYFLAGSELVDLMISPRAAEEWPDLGRFLQAFTLIVAVRGKRIKDDYRQKLDLLSPRSLLVLSSRPLVSSRHVREALQSGKPSRDLLPSLKTYVQENWLYVAVGGTPASGSANSS